MSDSLLKQVLLNLAMGPAQALQSATVTNDDAVNALLKGVAIPVFSEQVADAAASTDRVARIYYAHVATRILTLGVVVDTTATANGTNYKTLDVKKHANGGAIGSALATQITTASVDLTALTARMFTLTGGYIDLAAGDILVLDIGHASSGVQLSKFSVIGTAMVL